MKTSKSHSENNWPLVVACYKRLRVQETTRNLRKALKGTTRLEMTGILSEVLLIPTIFRQRLIFSCMFFFAHWMRVWDFPWKSRGGSGDILHRKFNGSKSHKNDSIIEIGCQPWQLNNWHIIRFWRRVTKSYEPLGTLDTSLDS